MASILCSTWRCTIVSGVTALSTATRPTAPLMMLIEQRAQGQDADDHGRDENAHPDLAAALPGVNLGLGFGALRQIALAVLTIVSVQTHIVFSSDCANDRQCRSAY